MKKWMEQFWTLTNRWKTGTKLILIHTILGVMPLMIFGGYSIGTSYREMLSYEETKLEQEVSQIKNSTFNYSLAVVKVTDIIGQDKELQQLLSSSYDSEDAFIKAYNECQILNSVRSHYLEIAGISVYTDNPTVVDHGSVTYMDDMVRAEGWYRTISERKNQYIWIYDDSQNNNRISMICILNIPSSDYENILKINLSDSYLNSVYSNSVYETVVTLNDNIIIYPTTSAWSGKNLSDFWNEEAAKRKEQNFYIGPFRGKKSLALSEEISLWFSNDTMEIFTVADCFGDMKHTLLSFLYLILLAVLLPFGAIFAYSRYSGRRIQAVRNAVHQLALEETDTQSLEAVSGTDELGELFQDTMTAIENVKKLDEKLLKEEMAKSELENKQKQIQFELLASQINPHFLFNTLESIRMKAAIEGQQGLSEVIENLGSLLRYALDNRDRPVTLEHELEYTRMYIAIQSFRYQDRFTYSIKIEPRIDTHKCYVLPLLLQPIIENIFRHGFAKSGKRGNIEVNIMLREELLEIQVQDDGCGMDRESLRQLQQSLDRMDQGRSIGIRNVHQRIKLYYGENYGLSIMSREGDGTTVRLIFPYTEDITDESIVY